jgi:hypothetical protein
MAAVEGLLYYADRPGNDYGSVTTQPWTIGWDEEDTRIRLKFIARAWMQSRTPREHEGACQTRTVRAAINLPSARTSMPCHDRCRAECSSAEAAVWTFL